MEQEIFKILKKYLYGENIKELELVTLTKIKEMINRQTPICFVMPAFPGKSPNLNSSINGCFGYEEVYSISVLNKMLNEINSVYKYGAKLYIIHDGHLFVDLNITRSDLELDDYIKKFREKISSNIVSITLNDLMGTIDYKEARKLFYKEYLKLTNEKELKGKNIEKEILFTKIEFYNQLFSNVDISKNQIQKLAKITAKKSLLIKEGLNICINKKFPNMIRLSIHYQMSNSNKLGIKLIDRAINFGSPWFNIIYECPDNTIILGKKDWFLDKREEIVDQNGIYFKIDEIATKQFLSNQINNTMLKEKSIGR